MRLHLASHCGEASKSCPRQWSTRLYSAPIARHQTTNHNLNRGTNTWASPPYRRAKTSQNWTQLHPQKKTSWPSYQRLLSTQLSLSASSVCLLPSHLHDWKLMKHFYRSWSYNPPCPHTYQVGAFEIPKDTADLLPLRTPRPPSHCQPAKERHTPNLRRLRTAPPIDRSARLPALTAQLQERDYNLQA